MSNAIELPVMRGIECVSCFQVIGDVENVSCFVSQVVIDGINYIRTKYHEDEDFGECHYCGIHHGGLHHYGCHVEECPRCSGRLFSCPCNAKEYLSIETPIRRW